MLGDGCHSDGRILSVYEFGPRRRVRLSYELARPNPSTVGPQFKEQAPKLSSGAREAF